MIKKELLARLEDVLLDEYDWGNLEDFPTEETLQEEMNNLLEMYTIEELEEMFL